MAYGDFKDLPRRMACDKVLCNNAFNVAENPKYDGYKRYIVSMVYKIFNKKSATSADKSANNTSWGATENEIKWKQKLEEEVHMPIFGNIWKMWNILLLQKITL